MRVVPQCCSALGPPPQAKGTSAEPRPRQVREFKWLERRRGVLAMPAMSVEEMNAIDDFDPRDVYDDYEYDAHQ